MSNVYQTAGYTGAALMFDCMYSRCSPIIAIAVCSKRCRAGSIVSSEAHSMLQQNQHFLWSFQDSRGNGKTNTHCNNQFAEPGWQLLQHAGRTSHYSLPRWQVAAYAYLSAPNLCSSSSYQMASQLA